MELALLLDMATDVGPDRVVITDTDGTSTTAEELRTLARRAAGRFAAADVAQVGFLGTNGIGLPVSLFGAAIAGVPFVPLNYRLSDEQLTDLLGRSPGMAVVAPSAEHERLIGMGASSVIDLDAVADGTVGEECDHDPIDPEQPALLLFTSGTTSAPKAAVLRHRHLTAYVISTVEFGAADETDAVLVSVPPYHIAGVSTILSNLFLGRRIVYLDPFDATRWLELVRTEGITHAMVVPTMLSRIVDAVGDGPADVPTLRTLAYGGAPMPRPVIEKALRSFGDVGFTNAYGLTETSSTITVLGPDDHRATLADDPPGSVVRLASAGRAVPGVEIAVLDDEGQQLPSGEVGDVVVRGEQVSGEYVGGAELPADGWFHTRDRGWLDGEGYLFIEGRSDDTIIRGGENIAPAEIEAVLIQHPAVTDCAVVGVADPEWGQAIAAAVVLADREEASPDDLRDWVKAHLRSSRTPDFVDIRAELPYTETGKLLRRSLRDEFETHTTAASPPAN